MDQIKEINPNFNPDDWEETRVARANHKRWLQKRQSGVGANDLETRSKQVQSLSR